ncbi:hypothetical protein BpHYR1_002017 [Brachionus plicatilis]|uniref:Uncharacterized protein n=1 Tax=Brachionus plicatilis TaxID=10195 RepID=A0A3M7QBR1_BRAPC|nr:hypothetical protein BpHYR1_002017 [Brachionus plicatilis]
MSNILNNVRIIINEIKKKIQRYTCSNETLLAFVHILKESETDISDIREASRQLKDLAVVSHSRGNSWTKIAKGDFFQIKKLLPMGKLSIKNNILFSLNKCSMTACHIT